MDVITQLELCLHEQTQIVANAACIRRVGSQEFLTFYCNPCNSYRASSAHIASYSQIVIENTVHKALL